MVENHTTICVGEKDTRVQLNNTVLDHTYITGSRNKENTFIQASEDINLMLYIRGREYATFAEILNQKFAGKMKQSIPTPPSKKDVAMRVFNRRRVRLINYKGGSGRILCKKN